VLFAGRLLDARPWLLVFNRISVKSTGLCLTILLLLDLLACLAYIRFPLEITEKLMAEFLALSTF
jgi:hypothetical protein